MQAVIWCSVGCKACQVALLHFKKEDACGNGDIAVARALRFRALRILFWNIMRTRLSVFIWLRNQFVVLLGKNILIISYTVRDHTFLKANLLIWYLRVHIRIYNLRSVSKRSFWWRMHYFSGTIGTKKKFYSLLLL